MCCPGFGFQRQILVTDVFLFLQLVHGVPARGNIFDRADFPERLANQLGVRISQHVLQERIDVGDSSRVRIQEKYAILGRLEESTVANFGSPQILFIPVASYDFVRLIVHGWTPFPPVRCLT